MIARLKLSIRHWKDSECNQMKKEILQLLITSRTYLSNSGYIRLNQKANFNLFRLLTRFSFFDYHVTNNGFTCYYHQIVLYCKTGYWNYRKGKFCKMGELEVHHISGIKTDNSASNLTYVTPEENKLLDYLKDKRIKLKSVVGLPTYFINLISKINKYHTFF